MKFTKYIENKILSAFKFLINFFYDNCIMQQKDRKRRAEKNRALGVKRLKIHPVATPKKITYCHHYLKGRCQQVVQCSLSYFSCSIFILSSKLL